MFASSILMVVALSDWKFQLFSVTATSLSDNAPKVVPSGDPGAGLHHVPEDPGIGLIPTGQPEVPKVERQYRPFNKAIALASLLQALLADLFHIMDKHVQGLHAVKNPGAIYHSHAWIHHVDPAPAVPCGHLPQHKWSCHLQSDSTHGLKLCEGTVETHDRLVVGEQVS